MTNEEAQRLLDEIRQPPRFIRRGHRYVCRLDGRVDVYRLSRSGKRAIFESTVAGDACWLPFDVRRAMGAFEPS